MSDRNGSALELENARLLLRDEGADADALYRRWFHRETGEHRRWPTAETYHAVTLDGARFERGWRAIGSADSGAGALIVMRGGRERTVTPPEFVSEDPRSLTPGRGAALRVDPFATGEVNGFWHLWSAGWQVDMPDQIARYYFNLSPETAPVFAGAIARAGPPRERWSCKILTGDHERGRRDGALLYVAAQTCAKSSWIEQLLADAVPWCTPALPPFVSMVAPGIGYAPDPGGGRSFGEALVAAVASARDTADDPIRFHTAVSAAVRALPGMAHR